MSFPPDLGPYRDVVRVATTSVSAGTVLLATWWPRTKGHPLGKTGEKIGGLATAVLIALLYEFLRGAGDRLLLLAIALAGLLVCAYCAPRYFECLRKWQYWREIPTG